MFVLKRATGNAVEKEFSSYVERVFVGSGIEGLNSTAEVEDALSKIRNVLAELAALYLTLNHIAPSAHLTIVHDYKGLEAWMSGRWKTREVLVANVVAACKELRAKKSLNISFIHQHGHQSTFAGRNDFVAYNVKADKLAGEGGDLRNAALHAEGVEVMSITGQLRSLGYIDSGDGWFNLEARKGFSAEVIRDTESNPGLRKWIDVQLREPIPSGMFFFFIVSFHRDISRPTQEFALAARLGVKDLAVRLLPYTT